MDLSSGAEWRVADWATCEFVPLVGGSWWRECEKYVLGIVLCCAVTRTDPRITPLKSSLISSPVARGRPIECLTSAL